MSLRGARVLRGDQCQCGACGLYFRSTAAFDKHRIGPHGPARRCRTATEMVLAGMVENANGFWITGRNPRTYLYTNSRSRDQAPDTLPDGSASAPLTESAA